MGTFILSCAFVGGTASAEMVTSEGIGRGQNTKAVIQTLQNRSQAEVGGINLTKGWHHNLGVVHGGDENHSVRPLDFFPCNDSSKLSVRRYVPLSPYPPVQAISSSFRGTTSQWQVI